MEGVAGQLSAAGGDGVSGILDFLSCLVHHGDRSALAGVQRTGQGGGLAAHLDLDVLQPGGAGVAQGEDHRGVGLGLQVGVVHGDGVHLGGVHRDGPAAGEELVGVHGDLVGQSLIVFTTKDWFSVLVEKRTCFGLLRVIPGAEDIGADLTGVILPGAEGVGQGARGQGDEGLGGGEAGLAADTAQLDAVEDAVVGLAGVGVVHHLGPH